MPVTLIADCGATKAEWCLINNGKKKKIFTQGISPYFLSELQIIELLETELVTKLKYSIPENIYYYGTGCANPSNVMMIKKAIKNVFKNAEIQIETDLMAAARATCLHEKGIACILGTGSNSCYYNGKSIIKNSPGIGYILGDEASGAYLGKKVIQYYLYNTFDEELKCRFDNKYNISSSEILDQVYKKPLANRYLAGFALFLAENRGHYMIENIIEDGINDFFFIHLCKYNEVWKYPVHFIGSVAFGFKDVIEQLCASYEFELGSIIQKPMDGLIKYHKE